MSPQEWLALPWWESRLYIEGYQAEGILSGGNADPEGEDDPADFANGGDPVELGFKVSRV